MLTFGGEGGTTITQELWETDGVTWTNRTPAPLPAACASSCGAVDDPSLDGPGQARAVPRGPRAGGSRGRVVHLDAHAA
jgi:hypothetical protein